MKVIFAVALGAGLLSATAALADVKSGVDAWNQGDYPRAISEWRPLAASGDADAQFNLGQAYKLGRGVPVDLPVALEWFRKASQQGHEKATDNYGLVLFQQGRQEEAMPYICAAADRGEARAQYVYATALFNGDLAPRDWVRAYALMTRASQAGLAQATGSLALMEPHLSADQRREGLALAASSTALATAPVLAQTTAQPTPAPAIGTPTPPGPDVPAVAATDGPKDRPPVVKRQPRVLAASQGATAPAAALPKPAEGGRYRIQLGAFREGSRAPALWKNVSGKVSGLSAFQPSYVVTNGLTRLLVGPLASNADAQRLCVRIKAAGTPCVVQGM